MLHSRSILASSVISLLAFCASAQGAGTFQLFSLSGDADSGISATDAFTVAIDANGGGNTTVNGAVFSSSFGGNPGTNGNSPGTNNYTTTGLGNTYGGNVPLNVTGNIGSMMQNFNYVGNPETVTMKNLRVGQEYTSSFYSDAFGAPDLRMVDFTTSDGGSFSAFNQNQGGTRLTYTFTAVSTSMTFTITPQNTANTFHNYAFSNRANGYKSLFTDNFRAPGNPDTGDVNFNIAARQGGSVVLSGGPISYSKDGNTQVGNDTGFSGQPYGGDYLLSAFGARTALNHNFGGAESAGGQSISFDFIPNTGNNGDTGVWESIELGMSDADKLTGVNGGATHFGLLFRGNGEIQAFDGGSLVSSGQNWGGTSINAFNHIELLLTDPTDSNPFDGVGQTDIGVYSNGALIYSYSKGGGGYADNFINFGAAHIGGVDNFAVAQVVPEPATAISLVGGLGMLLGLRRRRK